jgi:cytochrome c peroxidase
VFPRRRASLALGVALGLVAGASLPSLAVRAQEELAKKPEEKPPARSPNEHAPPLKPAESAPGGLVPHAASPTYVRPEGPPAVIDDWERPYPQYQPLGGDDLIPTPDAKPGDPNPPNLHRIGGRDRSSYFFPVQSLEPFAAILARESANKASIAMTQKRLLEERYDLTVRTIPGVTMSRGKLQPIGPTARLRDGITSFEALAALSPAEIKRRDLFPYLPLPHPSHATGGMVFPQVQTKIHPELDRFDVELDIPDGFLPEFPPPLFLTSRPDLGDVSRGQEITEQNFEELLDGIVPPFQLDGFRLLVERQPQQQFNQTDDRKTLAPSRGVSCFDCHVNGHTTGQIHLNVDVRPQLARLRLDTVSLRGVYNQKIHGSKRSLRSVEDFTQFEQHSAYFDHDTATSAKKGRRFRSRDEEVAKMAQAQNMIDFPPAPKLTVVGKLDPHLATKQELAGEELFLGKAQCAVCHPGPFFIDNFEHDLRMERFYRGRAEGAFKTSTLRGIKDSPPYLHDGRCLTLEDTVELFNLILETKLTREEKQALVSYLRTL